MLDSSASRILLALGTCPKRGDAVRERLIVGAAAAGALVTLLAIPNAALDAAAVALLVIALALIVRAAFRLVDEPEERASPERTNGRRHHGV